MQSRTLLAVLATVAVLVLATWHDLAARLDQQILYYPALQLRSALDRGAPVTPGLRLVVMDDASLARLDHPLSFQDLGEAAAKLVALGYRRVLVGGGLVGGGALPPATATNLRNVLAVGAVAMPPGWTSARATRLAELPARLYSELPAAPPAPLAPVASVIVPPRGTWDATLAYGVINSASEYSAPAGFVTAPGSWIPHLALLTGTVPPQAALAAGSADGRLYVDFVDFAGVLNISAPLASLLLDPEPPALLRGGSVALIIPDGYTGGRFVETPTGIAPSYVALASLVNGAMNGRYIKRLPWSRTFGAVVSLLFVVLLTCSRSGRGLAATAAALAALAVASGIALVGPGWYVPAGQVLAGAGLCWAGALGQHLVRVLADRVHLEGEISTGSEVQRLFLPTQRDGTFATWRYRVHFRPFGPLSGDWFQVYLPPPAAPPMAVFAIGDVMGKGASAALLTAAIAALWSDATREWDHGQCDLAAFVNKIDRMIRLSFRCERNTTLSLAAVFPDRILLVRCGTAPWVHLRNGWEIKRFSSRATDLLGYGPLVIEPVVIVPEPGDVFMAYSDGLVDGLRARTHFFEQAQRRAATPGQDQMQVLVDTASAFTDPDIQPDDATMLLLKFGSA